MTVAGEAARKSTSLKGISAFQGSGSAGLLSA